MEDVALLMEEGNALSDTSEDLKQLLLREWQIFVSANIDFIIQRPLSLFHHNVCPQVFTFNLLPLKDAPELHNVLVLEIIIKDT